MNYVNEERFIAWYESVAKPPRLAPNALLDDAFRRFADGKGTEYTIPADRTLTGREESYPFRCETVGACGACTPFMYF